MNPAPNSASKTSSPFTNEADNAVVWYLLIQDRYVGPFSALEVERRLLEGGLSRRAEAWTEGMSAWAELNQTTRFQAVTSNLPDLPATTWPAEFASSLAFFEGDEAPADMPEAHQELAAVETTPVVAAPVTSAVPTPTFPQTAAEAVSTQMRNTAAWAQYLNRVGLPAPQFAYDRRTLAIGLSSLAAIATCAVVAKLAFYSGRVLALPEETPAADVRELTAAASESISHPTAAVARGGVDPLAPVFFVGTNVKDGTKLEVRIDGRPETLLEKTAVSIRTSVTAHDGIAKTLPFRDGEGHAFPRGEYVVSIICSECATGAVAKPQLLGTKQFFLGGAKDANYDHQLQVFHTKLRAQALDEIAEIKQVTQTLVAQLDETTKQFAHVRGQMRGTDGASDQDLARDKEVWATFDKQWRTLQDPLEVLFQRWTNDAMSTAFVYGNLFGRLKQVGALVNQVHAEESAMIRKGVRTAGDEAKIESTLGAAQASIKAVKEKLALIADVPTTSNGMPQRPD